MTYTIQQMRHTLVYILSTSSVIQSPLASILYDGSFFTIIMHDNYLNPKKFTTRQILLSPIVIKIISAPYVISVVMPYKSFT